MTKTTFGQPSSDNKPEYHIALTIYDSKTGETVCKSSTYLEENIGDSLTGSESGETELGSLLRYFHKEARQKFEAVHYPQENDND